MLFDRLPGVSDQLLGSRLAARRMGDGGQRRLGRPPMLLETTWPGVFAAGDVRNGSIKRVASAVGEGAMAVRLVHEHLGQGGARSVQR